MYEELCHVGTHLSIDKRVAAELSHLTLKSISSTRDKWVMLSLYMQIAGLKKERREMETERKPGLGGKQGAVGNHQYRIDGQKKTQPKVYFQLDLWGKHSWGPWKNRS